MTADTRRFPLAAGRALVEEVIERARLVNKDDTHFFLVTELAVFGSLLREQADLGDVDIAFRLVAREGGPAADALWAAEIADAPKGLPAYLWPAERINRLLKGRRVRISLHDVSEVTTEGYPHFVVYRCDPASRAEAHQLPWTS